MEDEMELDWMEAAQRLERVAASLEEAAARIAQVQAERAAERAAAVVPADEPVGRIVATVDEAEPASSLREQELEQRLAVAEAQIARLTAQAPAPEPAAGRRTLSPGTVTMLAKQGVSVEASGVVLEAAALDGALASLSIEQRIAVKAELLRAGLVA